MWFKQIQLFQLDSTIKYSAEALAEKLSPLAFTPCLPSFPSSAGWITPLEEENAPLVHAINGNLLFCLQFEEKILPAAVVKQALKEKIKKIQLAEDRKIQQKEKLSLKDEVICTLLPKAFTKLSQIYAYLDSRNGWLVLGTTNTSKTEQFMALLKKSINDNISVFEIKKPSAILTQWLKTQNFPKEFAVEKACVLQDPSQQNRIIRCQNQNLFAAAIQSLLKEGCDVKQLALSWHDRVNFVLAENFSLQSLQYHDEVIAEARDINAETKQQEFDANFFIMTETITALITDLLNVFAVEKKAAIAA